MAATSDDDLTSETITLTLSVHALDLIVDGLHADPLRRIDLQED